jgi:AcrR family transcriptional regulator
MARTTSKTGEDSQQRILDAALPLFAEHGFAGTSTRLVAGAAEVNVATLAYYFGDKRGLYVAVMDRMYEDLTTIAPGALTMKGSPAETLDAVVERAWDFVKDHQPHIRLLIRHVLDAGRHEDSVQRWNEPLMQQATALVGAFRPGWPESHKRMLILTTMHSMVRLVVEDPDQLDAMLGEGDRDEVIVSWFQSFLKRELGL